MSGPGGWPGEDAETQILALPGAERQMLATLAVVGGATLSADELADLVDVDDVIPLIEDLERRKLIRRDEKKRYSAIGHVGEQIRKTDAAHASGDRLLSYFRALAAAGALTPERLADDAQAVLGLSAWAAENRKWLGVLELVTTLQASFGIAHRVREWLMLLERGRAAAQALGDVHSEIWMLQQLATATAGAGDAPASQLYLREADQLQRESLAGPTRREVTTTQAPAAAGAAGDSATGVPRVLIWIGALVLAAVIGAGLGFAIGDDNSPAGTTTAPVSVTLTEPGTTVTTEATVTLPASTVVTTETATETTTTLVTTTVVGVP